MEVIKNREVITNRWLMGASQPIPSHEDVIVPVATWLEQSEMLKHRSGNLGLLIDADDDLEALLPDLNCFHLIALSFPKYTDGRCFSFARLLRDRYEYKGELRAVGNILRDQLGFLERCGFDSVLLSEYDLHESLQSFDEITVKYQTAADRVEPAYRYR